MGFAWVSPGEAAPHQPEKIYQKTWCHHAGGKMEVRQSDRTRVDCLTGTHAIEVDFARKWTEAIGQALHYALQTNKQPGVVLILEKEEDEKYWKRLIAVIRRYRLNIQAWKMTPDDLRRGRGRSRFQEPFNPNRPARR